jgi:hypothetical protein
MEKRGAMTSATKSDGVTMKASVAGQAGPERAEDKPAPRGLRLVNPATVLGRIAATRLAVARLTIPPTELKNAILGRIQLRLTAGSGTLRNVRVTVKLGIELDYEVNVDLNLGFTTVQHQWSDRISLPDVSIPLAFGDVALPNLETFDIDIPSSVATGASLRADGCRLECADLALEGVQVNGIATPGDAAGPTGIRLSASLPRLDIGGISATRFLAGALRLEHVELRNVVIEQARAGVLRSGIIEEQLVAKPYDLVGDAGVLKLRLRFTPAASLVADGLELDDNRIEGSVEALRLADLSLPLELNDISFSDLSLDGLQFQNLEVG